MLFAHHRHRAEAGTRRLFAMALAVVAVVAGSVAGLSVTPASADPPPDFETKVKAAFDDARVALQRPQCVRLLSAPLNLFPPLDVLNTATTRFLDVPPPPLTSAAAASVQGTGLFQPITFYPAFFRYGVTTQPDGTRIFETPRFDGRLDVPFEIVGANDRQLRTVAILHEVGHLTGVEGQHRSGVDDAGNPVPATVDEGLYNTRIFNTCIAERHLIAGMFCDQHVYYNSIYSYGSTLTCVAECQLAPGPMTVSWTSNLHPSVVQDVRTSIDGESCVTVRTSDCPAPTTSVPRVAVTLTVSDGTGHTSADTHLIECFPPFIGGW
jgi:hypothetical protein